SLYSSGALIAFTAAQLAVLRLRFSKPDLERPFRVPGNVRIRGVAVPVAPLVGAPLTFALWIAALATHNAARIAGPIWLALGVGIFVAVRRREHERLLEHGELLGSGHGGHVEGEIVRARAIGEAIVDRACTDGVDLILLGSAPRWRRQSRFFSPTVDYVLRRAPCEVMVITYPQGVLEG